MKKCPFCGCEYAFVGSVQNEMDRTATKRAGVCEGCRSIGPARKSVREAIEAWDMRSDPSFDWMDASSQLPNTNETVIVLMNDGSESLAWYANTLGGWQSKGETLSGVAAWRSLAGAGSHNTAAFVDKNKIATTGESACADTKENAAGNA